jgi:hypothetical protein
MRLVGFLLCAALLAPSAARADTVAYFDSHPVAPEAGGGYCYLEGAHEHDYAPAEEMLPMFRECDGQLCFVGDPVPFGYGGEVVAYDGQHPLYLPPEGTFCYLVGLHYHVFFPYPAVLPYFIFWNGAYVWNGPFGAVYERDRARYERKPPAPPRNSSKSVARYYTPTWRTVLARRSGHFVLRAAGARGAGTKRVAAVRSAGAHGTAIRRR